MILFVAGLLAVGLFVIWYQRNPRIATRHTAEADTAQVAREVLTAARTGRHTEGLYRWAFETEFPQQADTVPAPQPWARVYPVAPARGRRRFILRDEPEEIVRVEPEELT